MAIISIVMYKHQTEEYGILSLIFGGRGTVKEEISAGVNLSWFSIGLGVWNIHGSNSTFRYWLLCYRNSAAYSVHKFEEPHDYVENLPLTSYSYGLNFHRKWCN